MYLCYLLIKYYIYTYSNTLARILLWIFFCVFFWFACCVVVFCGGGGETFVHRHA